MSWRQRSHTADVKVTLVAPDLPGLYGDAVDMLRHLLVGDSPVLDRQRCEVLPEGDTDDERFFRFVRELLYLNDVDGFVPVHLVAPDPPVVGGETFDPERHDVEHAIKALTRHQYRFERRANGCRADMVFDL